MVQRLAVLLLATALAEPSLAGWLDVESISSPDDTARTCENNARAVVGDRDGRLHVAWAGRNNGVWQVHYSRSDSGHGQWSPDTTLSAGPAHSGDPCICIDTAGNVSVAWIGQNLLRLRRRAAATGLWDSSATLPVDGRDSAVSIATDDGGTIHAAWNRCVAGAYAVLYSACRDGIWDSVVALRAPDGIPTGRAAIAAARNGDIAIAWPEAGTVDAILVRRRIGGAWQQVETLYNTGACHTPCLTWSPDTNLHAVWLAGSSQQAVLYRCRTATGWQDTMRLCRAYRSKTGPSIAADGTGGLLVAWAGTDSFSTNYNQVYYVRRDISGNWTSLDTLTSGVGSRSRTSVSLQPDAAQVVWCHQPPASQRLSVRLRRCQSAHDVALIAIDSVPRTSDSGTVVRPRARIVNRGEFTEMMVMAKASAVGYVSVDTIGPLEPGDTAVARFDPWLTARRDTNALRCSTGVFGDHRPWNDTLSAAVIVQVKDVGALAITSPEAVVYSESVRVSASVRNNGNVQANCQVRLSIDDAGGRVRVDSVALIIHAGESTGVSCGPWQLPPGHYIAACSMVYDLDVRPGNDTASRAFRVVYRDVGVSGVLKPQGAADSGDICPQALVLNSGTETESFLVRFWCDSGYADTTWVESLAPGESREVDFDTWQPGRRGSHAITCSTMLAGDRNARNNAVRESVFVRVRDAAAVEIVYPVGTIGRGAATPSVRIANRGNEPAVVPTWFTIEHDSAVVYDESLLVAIAAESESVVDFPVWFAGGGSYCARSWTRLPDDMHPENDGVRGHVLVARVDAALAGVIRPVGMMLAGRVEPEVTVGNNGEEPADVLVQVTILDSIALPVFGDSARVPAIPAGERRNVRLREWNATPGSYRVAARVTLVDDENPVNDTASASLSVESLAVRNWTQLASVPSGTRGWGVGSGGCLAAGNGHIYATKGRNLREFYCYDLAADSWTALTPVPAGAESCGPRGGAAMTTDGSGLIFLLKGNRTRGFWLYHPAADSWTAAPELPGRSPPIRFGAGLAFIPDRDTPRVYCVRGGGTCQFLVYWVRQREWHARRPLPAGPRGAGARRGTALVAIGSRVFCIKGQMNEFYEYQPASDNWQARASLPLNGSAGGRKRCRDGAALATDGSRFIYALKGGGAMEFWRYDVIRDEWRQMEDIPYGNAWTRVRTGAALAGANGMCYALKGGGQREFWRFDPNAALDIGPQTDDAAGASRALASTSLPGVIRAGRQWPLPPQASLRSVRDASGRSLPQPAAPLLLFRQAGVYFVTFSATGTITTRRVVVVR